MRGFVQLSIDDTQQPVFIRIADISIVRGLPGGGTEVVVDTLGEIVEVSEEVFAVICDMEDGSAET